MAVWHPWRWLRHHHPDWHLEYRDLPEGVLGVTDCRRRVIVLANGLTQAQRRSTLTHELVHAWRGDEACTPAIEAAVEAAAARLLIPLEDLVNAVKWTVDLDELADELWVDVDTVHARLRHLHPAERAAVARVVAARCPVA